MLVCIMHAMERDYITVIPTTLQHSLSQHRAKHNQSRSRCTAQLTIIIMFREVHIGLEYQLPSYRFLVMIFPLGATSIILLLHRVT